MSADESLLRCVRVGCPHGVKHATQRRPGVVADDYCGPKCIPTWLRALPGSYTERPRDRWLRGGSPT